MFDLYARVYRLSLSVKSILMHNQTNRSKMRYNDTSYRGDRKALQSVIVYSTYVGHSHRSLDEAHVLSSESAVTPLSMREEILVLSSEAASAIR